MLHFPFDIVDGSVSTWSARSLRFIGEPIFVPKGDDEDDGYLLVVEVRNSTDISPFATSFMKAVQPFSPDQI